MKYKTYNSLFIKNISITISSKKNLTLYWAFVSNLWLRISKKYYYILVSNGVKIIPKNNTVINKSQCLGITIAGSKCKRFVSNNYCFQHKTGVHTSDPYDRMRALDQFYTTQDNANLCSQLYSKSVNISYAEDIIIEPSAGNGAFINSIDKLSKNTLFIDIDPKHNRVQECDFFKFNADLKKFKKVHVVGNPPFNILNQFLKQAFKLADSIGFILPLSYRKDSRKKVFPLNFHCVHEHIFLDKGFYFNGKIHKVNTVFQIWEKRAYNRAAVVKISSQFVKFVKKTDNPTLAFRRVGGANNCGELSSIIQGKSVNTHYFIKLQCGLDICSFLEVYKKIVFSHNNTVAQKSISQQELLIELNKHGI